MAGVAVFPELISNGEDDDELEETDEAISVKEGKSGLKKTNRNREGGVSLAGSDR